MANHVAVIDIGKTNAKVALVDLEQLREVDVRKTTNAVEGKGIYPHHDVERLWQFILGALAELHKAHGVKAISVTTHGATAALLRQDGRLALPILDYEHNGPDETRSDYDSIRPGFIETGSPSLPVGLNIGTQFYWQNRKFGDRFDQVAAILMYPQYWAFRLAGKMANEVTSLGCHTDLWNPARADFSTLVDQMSWRRLFAPVRAASDRLGVILPEVVAATGLEPTTPVACGLHDSNASLLPHLTHNRPPFAVVSTGTWVVSMAIGGRPVKLDPARDTLINVNAFGDPVPSARFMGGREFEMLGGSSLRQFDATDVAAVLQGSKLLLPSVQPGSGPFPADGMCWIDEPVSPGQRAVAVSFYLALMTATCLDLIGAEGDTIIEGPFSSNELFLDMLSAATGRAIIAQGESATGTSIGAALLFQDKHGSATSDADRRSNARSDWIAYANLWRTKVKRKASPPQAPIESK